MTIDPRYFRPGGVGGGGSQIPLPFDPLSLSPALWLKADAGVLDGSGNPIANNGTVGTWQDQSGNARHVTQALGSSQPSYYTNQKNTRPAVRFWGDDQLVSAATPFTMPKSFYAVTYCASVIGTFGRIFSGHSLGNLSVLFGVTTGNSFATFFGNGSAWNDTNANTPTASMATWKIFGVNIDAGGAAIPRVNGVPQNPKSAAGLQALMQGYCVGSAAGDFYNGPIGELIACPLLTPTQITDLENYLNLRWGIWVNVAINSATIDAAGTTLTLVMAAPVTNSTGFTIAGSGGPAATLTYTGGSGTATLTFTISRPIWQMETATVSYAPGNVTDGTTPIGPISPKAATNNSTFGPRQLNPQFWVKADAGLVKADSNPASADGDAVATWQDQSGSARHAASTGGPAIVKLGIQNGLPVVRSALNAKMQANFFAIPHPSTMLGVFANANTNNGYMASGGTITGMMVTLYPPGMNVTVQGPTAAGPYPVGSFQQFSFEFNSTTSKLYHGGTQVGPAATVGVNPSNGVSLFSRSDGVSPAACDIAEWIVVSGLSDANRQMLEAYLNQKWNLYAPVPITGGTIDAAGTTATITFAAPVTGTYGVKLSGGGALTYVSGSGTATLTFSLASAIWGGVNVTANYYPGNLTNATGKQIGPSVNVAITNNSTGSPLSLNPQMWFKADAGVWDAGGVPITVDGTPVATWRDQSGFNRHATQATVSKQPTLKLAIQNGKPIVRGDGVDDLMQTIAVAYGSTATICAVLTTRTSAFGYPFSSVGGTIGIALLQNPPFYMYAGNYGAQDTAQITYGVFNQYSLLYSGATSQFWRDGVQKTPADVGGGTGSGMALFGSSDNIGPCVLDLAEILVFTGILAVADRQTLEGYLKSRWATP